VLLVLTAHFCPDAIFVLSVNRTLNLGLALLVLNGWVGINYSTSFELLLRSRARNDYLKVIL